MSRDAALAYIAAHRVLTLATSGPDGVWAAALFYVNDDFDFFFLSAAHTRHAQQMDKNAQVAATIQEDYASWEEIKGIQLAGTVSLLSGVQREEAIRLYREKFRFLEDTAPDVTAALARVSWYRLRPESVYFVDNSQGFGHRERVL